MRLIPALLVLNFAGLFTQASAGKYKVRVVTWNVNLLSNASTVDFNTILGLRNKPDIIFFAMQGNSRLFFVDYWHDPVKKALSPDYKKVQYLCHAQMCSYVYARKSIANKLQNRSSRKIDAYGISRYTKGAVNVHFHLEEKSVLFTNCFLPSKFGKYSRRIRHAEKIRNRTVMADFNFWAGDFNFRLNNYRKPEVIVKRLKKFRTKIFQNDELLKALRTEKAFENFMEQPVKFKPTYRFHVGTNDYDINESPAWTDRVLYWKRINGGSLTPVAYNSIPAVTLSTHKPVFADFLIEI